MQSKNKKPQTRDERLYVSRLAGMRWCACCQEPCEPEIHELEQGDWFTSIPLCTDCHRGKHNGLHENKAMWTVQKLTELGALGRTIRRMNA
jgi:hypothetical protein